ncbi:MAG TPA: hypothetical protein VMX75_04745 [Spirochaetia bacterium]|nr:hypothetical protein [Spirochaetia bacterium]
MKSSITKYNYKSVLSGKIIVALIAFLIFAATGAFSQSHETLFPSLVNLPGWNGDKPEGVKLDMGAMKMVTASRNYTQGDKELTALIMIGNAQGGGSILPQGTSKMETDEAKVSVQTINGYQVQVVYNKKDHGGLVTVVLIPGENSGTFFNLTFEGLTEDEGMALAKRFDWNGIKAKAQAFK